MKKHFPSLLALSLVLTVSGCAKPPNAAEDFAQASGLCIGALSPDGSGPSKINDAGWEAGPAESSAPASSKSTNQFYTRGSLSLSLSSAGTARCFVDGAPSKVGTLAAVTKTLSKTLGTATKENEGTYRWQVPKQGLMVKLSQTNTESEEVLRLYVFRPNTKMIEGVGNGT